MKRQTAVDLQLLTFVHVTTDFPCPAHSFACICSLDIYHPAYLPPIDVELHPGSPPYCPLLIPIVY